MTKLSKALSLFKKKPRADHLDLKLLFVSVDPDRDSKKDIDKFLTYFNNDFIGVTGKSNDDS